MVQNKEYGQISAKITHATSVAKTCARGQWAGAAHSPHPQDGLHAAVAHALQSSAMAAAFAGCRGRRVDISVSP